MTTRLRLATSFAIVITACSALVIAPTDAYAQDVVLSKVPKGPCCFNNFRYSGTCVVQLRQGQYCENILSYLNNFNSSGEAYCGSTPIRGGWTLIDCVSGAAAGPIGHMEKQYIQSEEPTGATVTTPSETDLLSPKQRVPGAIDRQELKVGDASVIQVRLEQPLDGGLEAGQALTGRLESDLVGDDGAVLVPAGSTVSATLGGEPGWDLPTSGTAQLHMVGTTSSAADLFGTVDDGTAVELPDAPAIHLTGDLVELSPDSVVTFRLTDVSDQPEDLRVLTTATTVWMNAFNNHDAVTIAGLSSEDGALLPPNGRAIIGRDAIYTYWQNLLKDSPKRVEIVNVETVVEGDLGYKAGRFELLGDDGGVLDRGKYIQIWKRSDRGYWELYRDMWNSSMAPPSTPDTE